MQRTVWKDGVQVSASLPNEPHPERFAPKTSSEVDHVVRAWVEAGLGGGWSSVASLRTFAVLNDYASVSVSRQLALDGMSIGGAWSLVSDWKVKRVEPGERGTKVVVALNVVCRIDETGRPAALRIEVPLTMEVVEADGMWKPVSPPGPLDVLYRSYYLSHLTQAGDGHYRQAVKDCTDADPAKPKVLRSRSPQGPKRTKPLRRAPMPRKRPVTQ